MGIVLEYLQLVTANVIAAFAGALLLRWNTLDYVIFVMVACLLAVPLCLSLHRAVAMRAVLRSPADSLQIASRREDDGGS